MAVSRALFLLHHETINGDIKHDRPSDNEPIHTKQNISKSTQSLFDHFNDRITNYYLYSRSLPLFSSFLFYEEKGSQLIIDNSINNK